VYRLADLRYVLYETKGGLSVVPEDTGDTRVQDLAAAGLRDAAGYAGAGNMCLLAPLFHALLRGRSGTA
jgi:hypothetical protein